MPPPSHFSPPERQWLQKRMEDADILRILGEGPVRASGERNAYLRKAADVLYAGFKEAFPAPYGGETDAEYRKRSKKSHHKVNRKLGETHEEWLARMQGVDKQIHSFVTQHHHVRPSRTSSPTPATIQVPQIQEQRKLRTITGFDVFQGSAQDSLGGGATGEERYPVGPVRSQAAQRWKKMTVEERSPYDEEASRRNEERIGESPQLETSSVGSDAAPVTLISAESIARWLKAVMKMLEGMNWGGFVCVGGPDEHGQTRTFIDKVGENRHGNSLLDAVSMSAGWSSDELEATLNVWLEQCKTTHLPADNNPETLGWHFFHAMRMNTVNQSRPAPQGMTPSLSAAASGALQPSPPLTSLPGVAGPDSHRSFPGLSVTNPTPGYSSSGLASGGTHVPPPSSSSYLADPMLESEYNPELCRYGTTQYGWGEASEELEHNSPATVSFMGGPPQAISPAPVSNALIGAATGGATGHAAPATVSFMGGPPQAISPAPVSNALIGAATGGATGHAAPATVSSMGGPSQPIGPAPVSEMRTRTPPAEQLPVDSVDTGRVQLDVAEVLAPGGVVGNRLPPA
ncbi:hypothetical protein LXA43DRAFT_1099495 [Ganoderma leucocontextum]|nr:hypothetical protein LXA43DRAFT_1099495 [Ganoderma leucocontextum]